MRAKRPSFQFYPEDWLGNSNLRRCSHEEKGIWIDVMCLLHDQEEYGIIRWSLKEIASAANTTLAKLKRLVDKGVLKGADKGEACQSLVYIPRSGRKDGDPVILIPEQLGCIWYSSRMVRDEYVRNQRAGVEGKESSPKVSPKGGIGEALDVHPPRAAPPSPSPSPISKKDSDTDVSGESPHEIHRKSENAVVDFKKTIFDQGLRWLIERTGKPEKSLRSVLGKWCKDWGDGRVAEAIIRAQTTSAVEPISFIEGVFKSATNSQAKSAKPTAFSGFDDMDYEASAREFNGS